MQYIALLTFGTTLCIIAVQRSPRKFQNTKWRLHYLSHACSPSRTHNPSGSTPTAFGDGTA